MDYGQFGPVAKATEILGEKWTTLSSAGIPPAAEITWRILVCPAVSTRERIPETTFPEHMHVDIIVATINDPSNLKSRF